MKRDLFTFKGSNGAATQESRADLPQGADARFVEDAQKAVEHYSNMSENELMQELQDFRSSGAMNDNALEEMRRSIAPVLNATQQQKLNALIRQLKS